MFFIFFVPNNSYEFGGIAPLVKTNKLEVDIDKMQSSIFLSFINILVSPSLFGKASFLCIDGFLKSQSNKRTFFPL